MHLFSNYLTNIRLIMVTNSAEKSIISIHTRENNIFTYKTLYKMHMLKHSSSQYEALFSLHYAYKILERTLYVGNTCH